MESVYQKRCPRCGGFLYDAMWCYYKYRFAFKNVLHCSSCGRDWVISMHSGTYTLEPFAYYADPGQRANARKIA